MKISVTVPALLALGAIMAFPLRAQYDMPDPNQPQPAPQGNGVDAPPPPDQPVPPPDAQGNPDQGAPDQSASFQTFYDNLGPQGTWIQSTDYGYVWQPNVSDPQWAPYTEGHWVYSDAGWTWASDEPWGWATYHYGRWVNLDGTGWCWVPGYTWAPAWVSWRYGDGYCGWAPLPPDSFVGIDYGSDGLDVSFGFHIGGDCDSYYGIGAAWYNFVPVTYLGYSNYHGHYANRYNNYALINRTTNVTNIYANQHGAIGGPRQFSRVTTGGPSLAQVNAVAQTPVQRVRLTSTSQPGGGGRLTNNSLALFAPTVTHGVANQPTHVDGSLGRATVNRGVDVTRPLAVTRTLSEPAPTQSQIQSAQLAQFSAPPHARVATASTPVNPILQAPLTTMKPLEVPATSPSIQRSTTSAIVSEHANPFVQPTHPAMSAPSSAANYNGVENTPHASASQPKTFYEETHPTSVAPVQGQVVHTQAAPEAAVTAKPQHSESQAAAAVHSESAPMEVHQTENVNTPQNNPSVQREHSELQPATTVHAETAPTVVHQTESAPVHTQTAPAPQPQSAPTVVHHTENNNQPAASPQSQPQSYPSPSNYQGGGNHNSQGGNGGDNHRQQNH